MSHPQLSLYEMRIKSGKAPTVVSKQCNVTYQSLRNWETHMVIPNVVNISDLLEIYGFSFDQLNIQPFIKVLMKRNYKMTLPESLDVDIQQPKENQEKIDLYEMRKQSGQPAYIIARLYGLSHQSLRNWENGVAIPNIVIINELLKLYGYTFEQLNIEPFFKAVDDRIIKQNDIPTDSPHIRRIQKEITIPDYEKQPLT